jgi:hypothetical protein
MLEGLAGLLPRLPSSHSERLPPDGQPLAAFPKYGGSNSQRWFLGYQLVLMIFDQRDVRCRLIVIRNTPEKRLR